jgi:hypothetical protein
MSQTMYHHDRSLILECGSCISLFCSFTKRFQSPQKHFFSASLVLQCFTPPICACFLIHGHDPQSILVCEIKWFPLTGYLGGAFSCWIVSYCKPIQMVCKLQLQARRSLLGRIFALREFQEAGINLFLTPKCWGRPFCSGFPWYFGICVIEGVKQFLMRSLMLVMNE